MDLLTSHPIQQAEHGLNGALLNRINLIQQGKETDHEQIEQFFPTHPIPNGPNVDRRRLSPTNVRPGPPPSGKRGSRFGCASYLLDSSSGSPMAWSALDVVSLLTPNVVKDGILEENARVGRRCAICRVDQTSSQLLGCRRPISSCGLLSCRSCFPSWCFGPSNRRGCYDPWDSRRGHGPQLSPTSHLRASSII